MVKVTTPLLLEGPLAAEILELPPVAARDTVSPTTGLLLTSNSVMVIVEAVAPSAGTDVGLAVTVEFVALATAVVEVVTVVVVLLAHDAKLSAAIASITKVAENFMITVLFIN
jgi:hypothetical protein